MRHLKQSFILGVSFSKLVGRICADQPEHLEGCNISVCPASDLRNNLGQPHEVLQAMNL
jgi:hypothetical protein